MNPLNCIDFYKVGHKDQYPEGTEYVYSNLTPRSSINGETHVIWFGLQYFIKKFLIEDWNKYFFDQNKTVVLHTYKQRIESALGREIATAHLSDLYDLGYLPIIIRSLPEGTKVPLKVPVLTIRNTDPRFFWLTNYLETALSSYLWKMSTSATTAFGYRCLLEQHAKDTGVDREFVLFQAHDFSFRGMSGPEDAAMSGAGHLTCFKGTDTIPAIDLLEKYYYGRDIGYSVPATEHSVMCMGTKEDEFKTFKRLIKEVYPTGYLSVVSDTWDLWKVIDEYLPKLQSLITHRNGRIVIRPDSGDPVKISLEVIDRLITNFKSTKNNKGYTRMHNNLGVIYGDSITLERAKAILEGLKTKGYSSDNMVFGVGSYTYQYKTRDNLGWAMKATWGQVKGEPRVLYKDPITDNGNKKSAKGILSVIRVNGEYILQDNIDPSKEFSLSDTDCLITRFRDGVTYNLTSLREIRTNIEKEI